MIHNTINFVQGIITQHEIGDIWLDSFTLNKPDKVNNDLITPPSADNLTLTITGRYLVRLDDDIIKEKFRML